MLSFMLHACEDKKLTKSDVFGKWENTGGAELFFSEDGKFTAKSLPAELILIPKEHYLNVKFDGSGQWELKKDKSFWAINLDFKEVSNSKCSSAFTLLIAGEKGILENQPPWYLFFWEGEEGGERYKFFRSK